MKSQNDAIERQKEDEKARCMNGTMVPKMALVGT